MQQGKGTWHVCDNREGTSTWELHSTITRQTQATPSLYELNLSLEPAGIVSSDRTMHTADKEGKIQITSSTPVPRYQHQLQSLREERRRNQITDSSSIYWVLWDTFGFLSHIFPKLNTDWEKKNKRQISDNWGSKVKGHIFPCTPLLT